MRYGAIIAANEGILPPQTSKNAQFSDAFSESNENLYVYSNSNHTGTSPFFPIKKDVCISNSLFHDCTSSSSGGAVASEGASVERIFIEETTFTTCKTMSTFGGAVFFYNNNNGECAIFRVCGYNCSSTRICNVDNKNGNPEPSSSGQYALILTKNDASSKNEVNESVITGSRKDSTVPSYAIGLQYSNIICSSVNITYNECYYYPALYCWPTEKTSVCTCCIICTSIVNNSAKEGHGCIWLDNSDSTQLISTCNIIDNKQEDAKTIDATIRANANLFINDSCIIGNNEVNVVLWEGSSSCQITVTNCTLDSDFFTSRRYSGSLTNISCREYSSINAMPHVFAEKCNSETRKRITCFRERKNDTFSLFWQYMRMIIILPSFSVKCNHSVGIDTNSQFPGSADS